MKGHNMVRVEASTISVTHHLHASISRLAYSLLSSRFAPPPPTLCSPMCRSPSEHP